MKTQVIHLETHDDLISIKDKMGWSQTPRILLVFPQDARILHRGLDVLMISRHSAFLGGQLAFVTKDNALKEIARAYSIPLFETIDEAQRSSWLKHRGKQPARLTGFQIREKHERETNFGELIERQRKQESLRLSSQVNRSIRILLFTLSVISVLAVVGIMLPGAEVNIRFQPISHQVILPIQASTSIDQVSISGKIPARQVTVIVEGRDSIPTTGSILVPDRYAQGSIDLLNTSEKEVTIPEGQAVKSSAQPGVSFEIIEDVTLPAGTDEAVSVDIKAKEPGIAHNVNANIIDTIDGPSGQSVSVSNPRAITGGTEKTARGAGTDDRKILYKKLYEALLDTALEDLYQTIEETDLILNSTPEFIQILEEQYFPQINQPGDVLNLTLRLEFQVLVADNDDLLELASHVIQSYGTSGFELLPDSINWSSKSIPILINNETANWDAVLNWADTPLTNDTVIKDICLGLPVEVAQQRLLDELDLNQKPRIQISPGWWSRLPYLPFRINIITSN